MLKGSLSLAVLLATQIANAHPATFEEACRGAGGRAFKAGLSLTDSSGNTFTHQEMCSVETGNATAYTGGLGVEEKNTFKKIADYEGLKAHCRSQGKDLELSAVSNWYASCGSLGRLNISSFILATCR